MADDGDLPPPQTIQIPCSCCCCNIFVNRPGPATEGGEIKPQPTKQEQQDKGWMTAIDSIGMMMILRACGVFASGREIIESNAKYPCFLA